MPDRLAANKRCRLHPNETSIGTVAGKRGRRDEVCEKCASDAAVIGQNYTFKPHEGDR